MGHKVSPISFRLQVNKNWSSRWFAGKDYAKQLHEDLKIRKFILSELGMRAGISSVEIERNANQVSVTINTAKPGVVIGRGGAGATELKSKLAKLTTGKIKDINVFEVKNPDGNAQIIADNVAQQLERRIAFKRATRQAVEKAQKSGVKGIKIMVGGRLNGAEIARSEFVIKGKIPLATINAQIDYATSRAKTTYGILGVKVWVYNGMAENKKKEVADVTA
jgi:small subunit ribosomal protein S3